MKKIDNNFFEKTKEQMWNLYAENTKDLSVEHRRDYFEAIRNVEMIMSAHEKLEQKIDDLAIRCMDQAPDDYMQGRLDALTDVLEAVKGIRTGEIFKHVF